MPLLPGTKLGPYEIKSSLGAGGMGEVYRATDTKLGRDVALKLLPPEMANAPERLARFQREAKSLAQLDHPNIVTIYSVEECDGVHFLTMQLVEGQPLDRVIPAGGLPFPQIVEIASSLGDALAAAHDKGIVHRDLKPANVMLSKEGRVKVLDFGLAKDVSAPDGAGATLTSDHQTQAGVVMGTPAYMSPEQTSGRPVDHRTDIFSLGVVLHEMSTGRRPFDGHSSAELISAILRDTPPPVTQSRPDLPSGLARIVRRCLEKDPQHRVQTARDVSNEFRDLRSSGEVRGEVRAEVRGEVRSEVPPPSAAGTAEAKAALARDISEIKPRKTVWAIAVILLVIGAAGVAYLKLHKAGTIDSIAVLPLENKNNDPDSDYIPDGITESINNSLAGLPNLTVIPHSVALHYKGKSTDVRKVGEELHVQSVLAGSVAERGNDLTIDVELDDIQNGKELWGEQYHRKLAELLAVQSDIAREVSQRLDSRLSAEDRKKLTKGSTDDPEAYRLYLKGKFYTDKFTKEGFDTGIDYFNQAIAVDPNYGLAYSGLAYNYINQVDWFMPPNEAGPKTKEAALKALAIDPSDARAHLTLAIETHWYEWNWPAAETEFKRSIELNPQYTEARTYYAWFLAPLRRIDEAVAEITRAQNADPLSPFAAFSVGGVLVFARQWDSAITQLRHAIELDPNYWFNHCFLGRAYEQKRQFADAITEFQRALEVEKDNAEIWSALGYAYAVSGQKAEAQKVLDHLKELSARGWVAPYNTAVIYAGLGEKDQAFNALEQAYKQRSYYLPTYFATDERLDTLRSDPRFDDLRKRIGLPK
jgi:serine/threonine protein kinase/tetratricopeptide (TPR) repeat protein